MTNEAHQSNPPKCILTTIDPHTYHFTVHRQLIRRTVIKSNSIKTHPNFTSHTEKTEIESTTYLQSSDVGVRMEAVFWY